LKVKAARYYVSPLSKVSLFYWLSESNGLASVPTPGMEGKQGTGERKPRNANKTRRSSFAAIPFGLTCCDKGVALTLRKAR